MPACDSATAAPMPENPPPTMATSTSAPMPTSWRGSAGTVRPMANLGGTASTEIDAPVAEVWAAIEDVLASPEWQGGLISMRAIESDAEGRPTLVETVNDA